MPGPARRAFTVEADGGSRGNPGPAGYGAVVRDADGAVLAEDAAYVGVASNNVAEYRGLIAGLRAVRGLDPDAEVRVRMDSKLVVEQMSGRWKIKHPGMRELAAEAREVFPPGRVSYEWIPREKNKYADRLANEAMDAGRRGEQWRAEASRAEPAAGTGGAGTREGSGARREGGVRGEGAVRAEGGVRAEGTGKSATPAVGWGTDLGAPTTFLLLRHGETALTPQKRFSGTGGSDPELSATGRGQAAAAAGLLAARGTVQAVVSSPLRRCRETAAAAAGRLGLDIRVEDGLRETDFGAWEGLTFAEVRERHPEDLAEWLRSTKAAPSGGGESFAEVSRRVAVARDKLLARYAGRTVLLVTHVTPIKTLVRLALGAPPESLYRMELSPAGVSEVAYYADGHASVRLLNDTSHLR
ncbi:bifunctional RNase H/acid phosphatase [Streptomyces sp. CMB-StM0423]|uniref:bifunctional RNase H/acid phosphatase n=1 Tax=Streptomyces sp. CMB-StM0423 TaxID=2059884 RepID=UPI000C70B121|nr:bifunctional RNase H/acid phosphatase [Streptomyces sp. CMB-StM0423]AUH43297.1 bifunctional RNase H/acid phosphatase [Streptomyces sp. CMB-StM0423]